jgi:hypothetical protein
MVGTILIGLMMVIQVILLCFLVLILYLLVRGIYGVPWVRTNKAFAKEMLEFAGLKPGDVLVDYGSGDGAITILAAEAYGAKGIGFEYLRALVLYAKLRAWMHGVSKKVEFRRENFLSGAVLPKADIISIYLFPEVNEKLEPLLVRDYPSGTRVISRTFVFPTLPLKATKKVGSEIIYLYLIP